MATTIAPSVGAGVLFTQQGIGSTPGYGAIDLRRAAQAGPQEGVIAFTDTEAGGWIVSQHSTGADLSVDIAANVGCARVQGDSVTQQGCYTVAPHSAVINEAIASNASGNPRVDIVILEVLDNVHDASGLNIARVRVITGTPSSGATLDNRTGAASLPSNAMLLADVLVPNADTTISNSQIRDRRPWANGFRWQAHRNNGSDYATSSGSLTQIDATNLQPRVEVSPGNSVIVELDGTLYTNGAVSIGLIPCKNGSQVGFISRNMSISGSLVYYPVSLKWEITPGLLSLAAGSHRFGLMWSTSSGTLSLGAGSLGGGTDNMSMTVREEIKANAANNSVTSG